MQLNPHNIKGILLDLDDTLYSYPPCNEAGTRAACAFLADHFEQSETTIQSAYKTARENVKEKNFKEAGYQTASSHSRLLYFQELIESLAKKSMPALVLQVHTIFWDAYFSKMHLFPGAEKFLKNMRKQGRQIAIVTNMVHDIQLKKLQRLEIASMVDYVVSSEQSGRDKPHPASLLLALKKMRCTPRETVFIGEDEKNDGGAAHAAGILPILIHVQPKNPKIIFVKNFKALSGLLTVPR